VCIFVFSGQVILDKNSNIRTVVNKVGTIETEFRTFPMEVIAGKECSSFSYCVADVVVVINVSRSIISVVVYVTITIHIMIVIIIITKYLYRDSLYSHFSIRKFLYLFFHSPYLYMCQFLIQIFFFLFILLLFYNFIYSCYKIFVLFISRIFLWIYFTVLGDADFVVTLKESNAKFNFNFKDVYWNSRLQMEHSRLIDFITTSSLPPSLPLSVPLLPVKVTQEETKDVVEGGVGGVESNGNIVEVDVISDKNKNVNKNNNNNNKDSKNKNIESNKIDVVVADMMAGVGPFAVPLAINRITVYANDLNPESFKYLNKNMKINHCEKYLSTHNQCAR
jgi:Met-10+ like-protein